LPIPLTNTVAVAAHPMKESNLNNLTGSVNVDSTDDIVGDVNDSTGGVFNIVDAVGAGDAGGVLSYGEITDNLSASTSYSPFSSSTILIGCERGSGKLVIITDTVI
jgi:hypothetical protein